MANYAAVIQIHNRAMAAHNAGIEAAKAEVETMEAPDGETEKERKARIDGNMAKVDMMDFQGAQALEEQLFQTLSNVTMKENQTLAAIAGNIGR